jgi:hypothetical protein
VQSIATNASPWLALLLSVVYWIGFVEAEIKRHYEPTGRRWPRLRERSEEELYKPPSTHFFGLTAIVFTFTLAIMYYHVHGGGIAFTVCLLIVYLFVALWCGPMLQIVPTYEGIALVAAAINFMLYFSVHKWSPIAHTVQYATLGTVLGLLLLGTLLQRSAKNCHQQS